VPVAGSAVNAAVASAITAAIGEAWLRLCEQVYTGKVDLANVADSWGDFAPTLLPAIAKMAKKTLKEK